MPTDLNDHLPPVIAIDGASASGKGTIAEKMANLLGFHYLDSGLLYRVLAWFLLVHQVDLSDNATIEQCASDIARDLTYLPLRFKGRPIVLEDLRTENVSMMASKVATFANVRMQLIGWQRQYRCFPGLVAEGRDMATTIFPDALLKVYLIASVDERARRRYNQLIKNGEPANLATVRVQLLKRDEQDRQRNASPLKMASDAKALDTTALSVDAVLQQMLNWWHVASLKASLRCSEER
ncbi:MAG: (d)CMP kinase [Neisseriales bacterium]|nr:MAG: (d)CMP kinase [Neisseriales bacterium]